MDKVYSFPDRNKIEQEAAEWLVRLDGDNELTQDELQALREWMLLSPLHKEELTSFGEFWSDQSLAALPISLETLYYSGIPDEGEKLSNWFYQKPIWGAMALLLVVISLFAFNAQWLGEQPGVNATSQLYATAIGQHRTVDLPDGSAIYLNTNSQVQVDFVDGYRNIFLLQGEAHFDVAKQPNRPFRVYAGRGRVEAVGTAFTVYFRDNEDIDVTVSEGKVALGVLAAEEQNDPAEKISISSPDYSNSQHSKSQHSNRQEQPTQNSEYYVAISVDQLGVLEAGQATTILVAQQSTKNLTHQLDEIETIAKEEIERRGAWRAGLIIFTGDSLEEVVTEISRYTTMSIEIVDPELKKIRIGGQFDMASTDALFNALEANFDLKITRLDYNRVEISSAQ